MGRRHHFLVLCFLSASGCAAPPAKAPPPAPGRAAETSAKPALPAAAMSPQDIHAITAQHNRARADVGVGPLQWSPDIAAFAQQWAEQLALSGCQMKHRSPNAYGDAAQVPARACASLWDGLQGANHSHSPSYGEDLQRRRPPKAKMRDPRGTCSALPYGENLFQGTFGAFTAVDAAKAWESEKKDFGGAALTAFNWAPAGHYTQMVWRQTALLGCGQAICKGTLIVACNYDPPGNVLGRRPF